MSTDPSWLELQKWSSKKQKILQAKKLQAMLPLFTLAPYYHSLFKIQNINILKIKTTDDLVHLPFTTKHDLVASVEHPEKYGAFVVNPMKHLHRLPKVTTMKLFFSGTLKKHLVEEFKPIHVHFTSGRSAMSIPVLYTSYDLEKLKEAAERIISLLKLPHTVRVVNALPFAPHLAFWQTVYATNHLGIFGLHTGGGKIMGTEKIIALLEKLQAEVLIGMPSYVYHLISTARQYRHYFSHLNYIFLGGEAVTPGYVHKLKELLTECFAPHVQVFTTYAFTEGKVAWTQCHEESGYHLYPDMEFIEVVDETGKRVPDGSIGEIVYTGLDYRGTVFLRYKTGDFGSLEVGPCTHCGAKTPRLSPIITRSSEIKPLQLTKVKGTLVDFNAIIALLSSLPYIKEWQIVLEKKKHFGLDEVLLYVSLKSDENQGYVKKEIEREMRAQFHITPVVIFKTTKELVEMLGLDTEVKEKRIVDLRSK